MAENKNTGGPDEIETVSQVPGETPTSAQPAVSGLRGKDRAAQFLKEVDYTVVVTPEEDRRILRKIDLRLLPIMLTIYCLQYLDKATLSYASVFGLIKDTHLEGEDYSWLGSIVYLAQLVFQPLVAYCLVTLPMGKLVAFIVFGWGAVLMGMVAATNFGGLAAARFLLGAFEAGIAPCFIAVVQMWYRRSEQTNRMAFWYAMLGVVNLFGSLLTYGLAHIDSPLKEYQIIFLFCGSLTVAFLVVVLLFMPDSPFTAKFLTKHDKVIAIERLRANQMGVSSGVWKWDHVRESCLDLKTWCWTAMVFSVSVPSSGISTFGPLIVKTFVSTSFDTILFNMPFGAVSLIATLGGAFIATRIKKKGPVIIGLSIPPIIGCIMLLCYKHEASHQGPLLAAYYLVSFYNGITPLIYSWSGQNTGGDTKRKCTTGLLFIGQCVGNVVGPHLYNPGEAPAYTRGLISNLVLFCVLIGLAVMTTFYLMFLNRQHSSRRAASGKSAEVVDYSMQSKQADSRRFAEGDEHPDNGGVGEKAFDDETDIKNEDFIYVY